MKIGVTIRQLRQSKKIRANVTYNKLLSRPAIIKFEKGESDTTAEKFLVILDRLNISLEEFEVAHTYNPVDTNIHLYSPGAYKKAFYNKDVEELMYLSSLSKAKYMETEQEKYKHNYAVINLLIDVIQNTTTYTEDLGFIQSYLSNCDYWSYYEIILFTNTLSFHSLEFVETTYKQVKRTINSYKGLIRYKNEFAILLFNILNLKITSNNLTSIDYYLNDLLKIKDECLDNMYIQTIIKFYIIIVQFLKGNIQSLDEVYKIISIFEFLDMNYKAEQCRNLIEIVTKEL